MAGGITVNSPIVSRPPTRHTGGNSGGHARAAPKPKAPKVVHVKAPKPPAAPHASGGSSSTRAAQPFVPTSNTSGIPLGTQSTDADLNHLGSGNQTVFEIEQEANQAMQRQNVLNAIAAGASVSAGQAAQFGIHIGTIPIGPAPRPIHNTFGSGGGGTARPPAPPRPPKVTAPLQLTDSGLQGHDSHVTGPGTLSPISPVTTRRPR
jgi:hypothetical protein